MKTTRFATVMLLFTLGVPGWGCVATTTSSTTWTGPAGPSSGAYARYGRVELIREIVQREHGNPAGGALMGAFIGSMIGGRGPAALVGAVGGAAIGAAASQGSAERRSYEVQVLFGDGGRQTFLYPDHSPFHPDQPVVMTEHGLQPL